MKGRSTSEKGHWFSLRRRRMQLVLAGLFVLAGLYIASGFGLLTSFGSSDQAYLDVPPSHYAYEHVQRLAGEDILGNVECPAAKSFCPGDPLDRQTAAVWLIRMIMDETPPYVSSSRFSDVAAGDWKAKYIEELAEREITSGCGDDANGNRKFCPEDDVRRKHMAIFIFRAFDLPPGPDAGFEDVRGGTYFESINALAAIGITVGCGDGTNFCPDRSITRAQTAIMLGRTLEWRDGPLEPEPEPEDTTPPVITVDFDHRNPALTARANETVSNWSYAGPLTASACEARLFSGGNSLGSGRSVPITDVAQNGKWYCFRARDAANNWGFKSRQVPADTVSETEETDTTEPVITVRYFDGKSANPNVGSGAPELSASANESVTDWAYIGPLNSAACANNLFNRGTRFGSSVALDGGDNGKWYCFRARDAANNWGFKSRQVPVTTTGDIIKPVLSVDYDLSSHEVIARANGPVKWSLQLGTGAIWGDCANVPFGSTATGLKSEHRVVTRNKRAIYYCFKAEDTAGNVSHSSAYYVDRKSPEVTFETSQTNAVLIGTEDDDKYGFEVRYDIPASGGSSCENADYVEGGNRKTIRITAALDGRHLCVRAIDTSPYKNTVYASKLLEYMPPESNEGTGNVTDPPASSTGYQPAQVVDTHYSGWGSEHDRHLDDNFLLATRQSAPSEHLSFKLTTPGSFRHSLTGPDVIIRGYAVYAIDYIDVSEKSGCYREIFEDRRKTSVNGLDIENQGVLNKVESDTVIRNGQLPLFTFQYRQFACVKVTLREDEAGGVDGRNIYKIFVTANPVEVSTADTAKYRGMAARDTYHAFPLKPTDFSHQSNKRRVEEHMASRFLVYATEPQTSGGRTVINLAVNLPGKFIADSRSDWERFSLKTFDYIYLDNVDDCDRDAFEGSRFKVLRHDGKLGQRMNFALNRDKHGKYLCAKFTLNADNRYDGLVPYQDARPHKIFSLKIDIPGADGSPSRPSGDLTTGSNSPASRTSNTLSATETLTTVTWLRGEDRVLSAQLQLEVANIIVNDTWESVALAEDAPCDETAFENADEINQGSEVTNPQTDTQHCFRAEDSQGATHYIAALVTEDSFANLAGSPNDDSRSLAMIAVIALGTVVGLGLIASVVILAGQNRRPKFR